MLRSILALVLAFATAAHAQTVSGAPAPPPPELVTALVEHLHVADTLTAVKRAMLQPHLFDGLGDEKAQNKLSAAWTATVNKTFDTEKILASVRSDIARSFTAEDLEWHRSFYQSELGQRLVKLGQYRIEEAKAASSKADTAEWTGGALAQMQEMQEELDADPARSGALKRLVAATGGEDAYIDTMMSIAANLMRAATAAAPPGEAAAKVEALIRTAEQYRPMLQVLVQPMILPVLAKLYEPLATRDIDDFAAALETPQGQRMTTGLAQLTGRTLSQLVMDFTTEFVRQSKAEMQ